VPTGGHRHFHASYFGDNVGIGTISTKATGKREVKD
jgi:hypothetical protein